MPIAGDQVPHRGPGAQGMTKPNTPFPSLIPKRLKSFEACDHP